MTPTDTIALIALTYVFCRLILPVLEWRDQEAAHD